MSKTVIIPFLKDIVDTLLDTSCVISTNKPKTKVDLVINPYLKVVVRKVDSGVKVSVVDSSVIKGETFVNTITNDGDVIERTLDTFITNTLKSFVPELAD